MRVVRRERRDLILLLLILPIGIVFMLIAGQFAIRMLPRWDVKADMKSNMDPNSQSISLRNGSVIEPVLAAILTPPAWRDTFLTPQPGQASGGVVPLSTFDPSLTPSPVAGASETATTASPTTVASTTAVPSTTATASPTGVTSTATVVGTPPTATATKTKKPDDPTDPPATDTATATPPPTTPPPTTPPPTTPPPVVSTINPLQTPLATPPQVNNGAPDNNIIDGALFPDGSYYVVSRNVEVNGPADTNYDLAYYEVVGVVFPTEQILMDQVIIGITNDNTWHSYYQVFYWGDTNRDTNSNVDTALTAIPDAETDNVSIPTSSLYPTPPAGSPRTGILIDVDNAPSNPPVGTYQWVVVIAPLSAPAGPSIDGGQTDAIEIVDVARPATPVPPAAPSMSMSMFSAMDESSIQAPLDVSGGGPADPGPDPGGDAPPPADSPPADNPPADNPQVDSNPAGDTQPSAPADNPPADNPPADNPPADNPPADNPPADTAPAVDPAPAS